MLDQVREEISTKLSPEMCLKLCYNLYIDVTRKIFDPVKTGKETKFKPGIQFYLNLLDC
jgi:hypothetical protein